MGEREPKRDAATVLVVLLVLLIGIPSQLVFRPLGAQGTPAMVLGIALLLWWTGARMVPGLGVDRKRNPVRFALGALGFALVLAYANGVFLHLTGVQSRGADRGMIYLAGLCGIALVASDGLRSRERLDTVLKTLVLLSAASAVLAMLSFFFGLYPVNHVQIPGLSSSVPLTFIGSRGAVRRVSGTAQHPLEFGILMAVVLPLAFHYATTMVKPRNRKWWICTVLIACAVPMAVSRAAIIGVAVAFIMLVPTWPVLWRLGALIFLPVYIAVLHLLVHGLFRTLSTLFVTASSDRSIAHRTVNYARVGSVMHHHWLVGTGGFGSYDPVRFDYVLDNAYLGQLFETGVIGLGCLLAVFWIALFCARGARRRSTRPADRSLAQSLAASVAVVIPGFFTLDAFAYPMATGTVFLVIGCCGALWRIARDEQAAALLTRPAHVWESVAPSS